ncbi:ABC transporter permease [Brachybacterium sp. GCM10030267]|uniref:ABC transporter permease n=1 Tax=Brachybacterium sp. GCM10030267 TaxID=3273381 RepID=UPI00361FF2A1
MRPLLDIRAYLDTRAAAIMVAISLILVAAFAGLGGLLQPALLPVNTSDFENTVIVLTLPLTLIIPIIAVLITAGEWSDGSIQVTLLQRPGRLAVLGSKTLAAILVVAALVAISLALAALATWIGGEMLGDGASFDSLDGVLSTQLPVIAVTLLFSLAMGLALQSTVLGLIAAIGFPFVVGTASAVGVLTGSEFLTDLVRAFDLQTAATAFGNGEATAFELIPLVLLVILPAAFGIWRWSHREVG